MVAVCKVIVNKRPKCLPLLKFHSDSLKKGNRLFACFCARDNSNRKAKDILYQLLVEHINSGKRTRRLVTVDGFTPKTLAPSSSVSEQESPEAVLS